MPKRRTYNFKALQGQSSASNKPGVSKDGDQAPNISVNERLSELRKIEGADAAQKKRDFAEAVSQRSVPPELRGILGVPESVPPRPKAGVRARERLRTPGPAPPKSWLAGRDMWTPTLTMRGGRRRWKSTSAVQQRNRPKQVLRFGRMTGSGTETATTGALSLEHYALKSTAEQWDLFDEDDWPALVDIPLRLRLLLVSYIGTYGPTIIPGTLQALTRGNESIEVLDLAGLAGHGKLTLKHLIGLFELEKSKTKDIASSIVVDSWDADDTLEIALVSEISACRFSSLTHLCLSHPPLTASWRDLLFFTKQVPQLTHLSLAYWPRPTLTPNLATSTVRSQHSPDISAGGSHIYSALDQDLTEPASLLRQLSKHLLCIQWLDLEGCAEWVPALGMLSLATPVVVPEATSTQADPRIAVRHDEAIGWASQQPSVISIFMGSWKNLTYLNCHQGWLPSRDAIEALPKQGHAADRRLLMQKLPKAYPPLLDAELEVEKRRAHVWLELNGHLLHTGRRVNMIRRARGAKPVIFDYGWTQQNTG